METFKKYLFKTVQFFSVETPSGKFRLLNPIGWGVISVLSFLFFVVKFRDAILEFKDMFNGEVVLWNDKEKVNYNE